MRRLLLATACVALLGGCVHSPAPAYAPSIAGLQALRTGDGDIAVGTVDAAPDVENERLGMRGNSMTGAGADGTFSTFLQQALETELRNAGRLDDASALKLDGTLTANRLDAAGSSTGRAHLGARFVLRRGDAVVYDRTIAVDHEWESSFMGAIAIPAAMQGYTATVQKLVATLFADPEFQKASG